MIGKEMVEDGREEKYFNLCRTKKARGRASGFKAGEEK